MYIPNIVIEGPDLTGKTSLQKGLLKATKLTKTMFVSDRSIMTRMMYSPDNPLYPYWEHDLVNFLVNNGMIYLFCGEADVVKERFKKRKDDQYNIDKILEMHGVYNVFYISFLANLPFTTSIDTDESNEKETIAKAKTFLEGVEKRTLASKVENLIEIVKSFGTVVGDTIELRNVRIQHLSSFPNSGDKLDELLERSANYAAKNKNSRYAMDIADQSYFYDMMASKMRYIIKKEIVFHNADPFTCRRFYMLNDAGSCVATFGINLRKNDKKIDMHVTAHIRSSDVVILPSDIAGIESVAESIIKPKNAKAIFGFPLPIKNFYFNIDFESVHIINPDKFKAEY